jgi:mono/diheme cytochrome c family protein
MIKTRSLLMMLCLIAPSTDAALLLGDAARGAMLHAQNCQGCHDNSVYSRPDRRVKSVEGLMAQVEMCNNYMRAGMTKEQRNDLVKYLNDSYYKFK